MIPFDKIKTIFLDYDGTIHNSIKIYEPAFKKAYAYLVEEGYAPEKNWKQSEISYWLGFSSKEMWKDFLPDVSYDIKMKASKMIGHEMNRLIEEGQAELYQGSFETLEYLKNKGYTLVFLSNCGEFYMNYHNQLFSLNQYFHQMHCSQQYNFIPKHEILKQIKNQYQEEMVMIGDRFHDIESGKINDIYTIACSYGYGTKDELSEADLIIDQITELKKYF